MKSIALLWLLSSIVAGAADDKPHPFVGQIERLDPAFERLVAADAQIEKLAEGFRWSEGPTWYDGGIVFSDVLANTAYRWKAGMTQAEVFLKPSGMLTPKPGFREPGKTKITGAGW